MSPTASNSRPRALIVDDEADIRELLEITLSRMGIDTDAAATLAAAREKLAYRDYSLCLTDMRLPDGDGLSLVQHIVATQVGCPTAVITAYGNAETAVASLKAGAFDFVSKPIDVAGLRALVNQALALTGLSETAATDSSMNASPRLIGDAPSMQQLRATIGKLARSQAPVYVSGESGTGKELVARSIHEQGPRQHRPFVPVNCGAIPSELMESEFFGYVRGAFTGASNGTEGLFGKADGGTLFLDEIAELPMPMQVKLLRAIQERAIRPVGAAEEVAVDVRLISATHRDLTAEVTRGRFREDLYYRLNVIEVRVPPLRERPEDIALLVERILGALGQRHGTPQTPWLTEAALDQLRQHPFPGNVRELENILERAVTLAETPEIGPQFLRMQPPLARMETPATSAAPEPRTAPAEAGAGLDLEDELEAIERARIQAALEACRYNKTRAAKELGITFRALRYRLAKLGMS